MTWKTKKQKIVYETQFICVLITNLVVLKKRTINLFPDTISFFQVTMDASDPAVHR